MVWEDKGQSTDVGCAWKRLRCERTWKTVVSKCLPGCLNTSENLLRLHSKAVLRYIIICVLVVYNPPAKKEECCGTDCMFSEGSAQFLVCNNLLKSGNDELCCINSHCVRTGVK